MKDDTNTATVSETGIDAPNRRKPIYLLLLVLLILGGTYAILQWRKHSINSQVSVALDGESGADTVVYRRELLGGNDVVFDVKSASGEMSAVDMTRRLLKSAEALKDADIGHVYLAYQGREKFYLDGDYFKRIGAERKWQNPVYTIRTMPENVRNLDGTAAFGTWTGGLIGVMGQQMNDNTELHQKWWMEDAIRDLGNGSIAESA